MKMNQKVQGGTFVYNNVENIRKKEEEHKFYEEIMKKWREKK